MAAKPGRKSESFPTPAGARLNSPSSLSAALLHPQNPRLASAPRSERHTFLTRIVPDRTADTVPRADSHHGCTYLAARRRTRLNAFATFERELGPGNPDPAVANPHKHCRVDTTTRQLHGRLCYGSAGDGRCHADRRKPTRSATPIQMPSLRQSVPPPGASDTTHPNPHRRETTCVPVSGLHETL